MSRGGEKRKRECERMRERDGEEGLRRTDEVLEYN